jgi:hypothetical protein
MSLRLSRASSMLLCLQRSSNQGVYNKSTLKPVSNSNSLKIQIAFLALFEKFTKMQLLHSFFPLNKEAVTRDLSFIHYIAQWPLINTLNYFRIWFQIFGFIRSQTFAR